jgi:hypothetical protein
MVEQGSQKCKIINQTFKTEVKYKLEKCTKLKINFCLGITF